MKLTSRLQNNTLNCIQLVIKRLNDPVSLSIRYLWKDENDNIQALKLEWKYEHIHWTRPSKERDTTNYQRKEYDLYPEKGYKGKQAYKEVNEQQYSWMKFGRMMKPCYLNDDNYNTIKPAESLTYTLLSKYTWRSKLLQMQRASHFGHHILIQCRPVGYPNIIIITVRSF